MKNKLKNLPFYFRRNLKNYLNESTIKIAEEQLKKTPLIIDDGVYLIHIKDIKELHEIKNQLENGMD